VTNIRRLNEWTEIETCPSMASYPVGTRGSFCGAKLTSDLLVQKVRIRGLSLSLPIFLRHHGMVLRRRDSFTFTITATMRTLESSIIQSREH